PPQRTHYHPTADCFRPPTAAAVPVALPLLLSNHTDAGALTVTLDGADFPPPDDEHAWTRKSFGRLLDAATREREVSMRVEVHETDGTSFTDLIPAKPRRTPAPEPEPTPDVEDEPARPGLV